MQTGLSLISIDDLIEEITKRKEAVVIAYLDTVDGEKIVKSDWSGDFILINGLAAILTSSIGATNFEEDDDED